MLSSLPYSTEPQFAETLRQACWDTPVLMSLFDKHDILLWANPAFRQAYALQPDQVLSWSDLARHSFESKQGALIETSNFEAWLASASSRRGKEAFRAFECDLCDGRWLWMTETVLSDGCMLCVASDITHLRRDGRDLRLERDIAKREALTDALTGVSNRSHLLRQLESHLEALRLNPSSSCGLAMLDLDYFKLINDNYGHRAGDTVLQHFALFMQRLLRREDAVGRLGGEEFLVLLPAANAAYVFQSMQRLLAALPHERPLANQPNFSYTCSIGASLLHHNDTIDTALDRIDTALYKAKNQGRSCYVYATPPA